MDSVNLLFLHHVQFTGDMLPLSRDARGRKSLAVLWMAANSNHTHSHIVDSHADSSVVINLLSRDGFGLIG